MTRTELDIMWMRRALALAALGRDRVSPNPMVGCVILASDGTFLGEGHHDRFGGPHAEVRALQNVPDALRHKLFGATYFVTLEPCAHTGKTPPCAAKLVEMKAGRVVVAMEDPFPAVAGRGIAMLRESGAEVEVGLCADEAKALNVAFLTRIVHHRPHVILKWAQSADGFLDPRPEGTMRPGEGGRAVTGRLAQVKNHQFRAEVDAILVGRRTAEVDRPGLTCREAPGDSPSRWVVDPRGRLDWSAGMWGGLSRFPLMEGDDLGAAMTRWGRENGVGTVIVEGGAATLNEWLRSGLVDELRVFEAPVRFREGLAAPGIPAGFAEVRREEVGRDLLRVLRPTGRVNATSSGPGSGH